MQEKINKCPVCGYKDKKGFVICPSCGYVPGFDYLKYFSWVVGVFLLVSFFLPWIDAGLNVYTNFEMVFQTGKISSVVQNDLGFNLKLVILVPIFAIWMIVFPFITRVDRERSIRFLGYQFSLVGFFGSFLLFFYLLKFGKYLAISVYLQFILFLAIWIEGMYILWKYDKLHNISFLDTEEFSPSFFTGFLIAVLIVFINYIIIPGKIIIGLKRFPEFRRR